MNHIIFALVQHLQDFLREGGYWVIGLVSILEAVPLFGTIIPGHTIVILGGFFARLGILNIYLVMAIAAAGAVTGDVIAFFLGKKYGMTFLIKWGKYFLIKEEQIEKAKTVLQRHSGKAILLGRWSPVTRALVPFLAGAGDVDVHTFWSYDIAAGIIWAVVSVFAGYVFGASYMLIAHAIGRFTAMGIIIALLIVIAYRFVNSRRHIFGQYDFHMLVISLASLYLFFQTIEDVVSSQPFMVALDVEVNLYLARFHTMNAVGPFLVRAAEFIGTVLSPLTLGWAAVILILWFIYKKHWQSVYISLMAYPVGLMFDLFLKNAVARDRPVNMLVHLSDYAFPSGHAVASALFFTLMIYFFARYIKNRYAREFFVVVNVILILIVCLSRVYLNVHWVSDVIAGSMFGVFWATFSILTVRYVEGLTRGRGARKLSA